MTDITLCQLDEVPAEGCKGLRLTDPAGIDVDVFLVNKDGQLHLYHNRCPHLGVALEWLPDQFLDREGQHIQCSTHGALFRVEDGLCVSGPCPGESLLALPFRIEAKSIKMNLKDIQGLT